MIDPTFGMTTHRVSEQELVTSDIVATEFPSGTLEQGSTAQFTAGIKNNATFIGDNDPDACGDLFGGDRGYEIRVFPVIDGAQAGDSSTVCVPAGGTETVTVETRTLTTDDTTLSFEMFGANSGNYLGESTATSLDVVDADDGGGGGGGTTEPVAMSIDGPSTVDVGASETWSVTRPSNAETIFWNWGDGAGGETGTQANHAFQSEGTYTISVTARDSNNYIVGNGSKDVTAEQNLPDIRVAIDGPEEPTVGQTVSYAIAGDDLTNDTFAEWKMGDGTSLSGTFVTHTYTSTGPYTIELRIVTADGQVVDAVQDTINVQPRDSSGGGSGEDDTDDGSGGTDINLDISGPSSANVGERVEFQVLGGSVTEIANYRWEWGDGSSSYGESPVKSYTQAGTYTVTVNGQGYDGNVVDSATQQIEIGGTSGGGDDGTDDGGTGGGGDDGTGGGGGTDVPSDSEIIQNLGVQNCATEGGSVAPGAVATIAVEVSNNNSFTVVGTLEIGLDGDNYGSSGFTLDAGESTTVTVTIIAPGVMGDYDIEYTFADVAQV